MNTFLLNTKAELWKSRRTAAYWITLLIGLFIPFIIMLAMIFKPDNFARMLQEDAWGRLYNFCWEAMAAFLLPMYVIMVTSLVVQIEYRNNTWKQVYASPRSYADVYFSKFLIIHLLILAALITFNLAVVSAGVIANAVHHKFTFFSSTIHWADMAKITLKMYVSVLGMTAIQYWLSLRLKNYIAPMAIGIVLVITGIIAMRWDKIIYYPYAYSALTYFKELSQQVKNEHIKWSYVWFAGIVILSFVDTIRRKERG